MKKKLCACRKAFFIWFYPALTARKSPIGSTNNQWGRTKSPLIKVSLYLLLECKNYNKLPRLAQYTSSYLSYHLPEMAYESTLFHTFVFPFHMIYKGLVSYGT
jgi:hypothetical protein